MKAIKYVLLAVLLCLPFLAQSQSPSPPSKAPGPPALSTANPFKYVVFIHCGPRKADDPAITDLVVLLARKGYSVREPESDQDLGGGPGVDYFDDQSRERAEEIASIVNDYLAKLTPKPTRRLVARKQTVKNSPTYLGVWLF
jgi:hypothetical protein